MSVQEITDSTESYQRRQKEELRREITLKHFLARDISQHVAIVLNGADNVQVLELWDFFPDMFEKEKKEAAERQMQNYKAQMVDFMYRHNHMRGGKQLGKWNDA